MKKNQLLVLLLLIGCFLGWWAYTKYFKSNTVSFEGKRYIYIATGSGINQVLDSVKSSNTIQDLESFTKMAQSLGLDNNIHPGRYEVQTGYSNYKIIKQLRSGTQAPVKLVINKLRTQQDIIKKLSSALEAKADDFKLVFNSADFKAKYGLDSNQAAYMIMPNTYEVYWNSTAEKVLDKLGASYLKFWNEDRKAKAQLLNLTIPQVLTVASIVEEETNKHDEKAKIASVYLNRYRIGMPLGADPTVKFAVGDFAIKRVLTKHTQFPSPYNTYLNKGLPPGPICTPSTKSIEAVLNPDKTNYLFFCAKEDFSGYHNFAVTYAEHQQNADRYQDALNKRNIK